MNPMILHHQVGVQSIVARQTGSTIILKWAFINIHNLVLAVGDAI